MLALVALLTLGGLPADPAADAKPALTAFGWREEEGFHPDVVMRWLGEDEGEWSGRDAVIGYLESRAHGICPCFVRPTAETRGETIVVEATLMHDKLPLIEGCLEAPAVITLRRDDTGEWRMSRIDIGEAHRTGRLCAA